MRYGKMPRFSPRFSLRVLLMAVAVSPIFFNWWAQRERLRRQLQIYEQIVVGLGGDPPIIHDLTKRRGFRCGTYPRHGGLEFVIEKSDLLFNWLVPGGAREVTKVVIADPKLRRGFSLSQWRKTIPAEIAKITSLKEVHLTSGIMKAEDVAQFKQLPALAKLTLNMTRMTNSGLKYVGELTQIKSLSLRCPVTGDGLANLASLAALEELELSNVVIDFDLFSKFRSLRRLSFCDGEIMPEAYAGLAKCAELESISLGDDGTFTETKATQIAAIPRLRELALYAEISDDVIVALSASESLEDLSLHLSQQVTERGLRALERLPLKRLVLHGAAVDVSFLDSLARMRSLREATVRLANVSDEQIMALPKIATIQKLTLTEYGDHSPALSDAQLALLKTRLPRAVIHDEVRESIAFNKLYGAPAQQSAQVTSAPSNPQADP